MLLALHVPNNDRQMVEVLQHRATPVCPQFCGLYMRLVEGGLFASLAAGRTGRGAKFPPQFGQTPRSLSSTHSRQNVHSKVQIMASVADGGKSLSQHSQLGRSSSMGHLRRPRLPSSLKRA